MDTEIHQANEEHLDDFKRELDEFSLKVYDIHLQRFEHVAESINTEKLEGVTLGELKKGFTDKIEAHFDNKAKNVHNITPQNLILT